MERLLLPFLLATTGLADDHVPKKCLVTPEEDCASNTIEGGCEWNEAGKICLPAKGKATSGCFGLRKEVCSNTAECYWYEDKRRCGLEKKSTYAPRPVEEVECTLALAQANSKRCPKAKRCKQPKRCADGQFAELVDMEEETETGQCCLKQCNYQCFDDQINLLWCNLHQSNRRCKLGKDCVWKNRKCISTKDLENPTKGPEEDRVGCNRYDRKKKCNKIDTCEWNNGARICLKRKEPRTKEPKEPEEPVDTCAAISKNRTCNRTVGCTWTSRNGCTSKTPKACSERKTQNNCQNAKACMWDLSAKQCFDLSDEDFCTLEKARINQTNGSCPTAICELPKCKKFTSPATIDPDAEGCCLKQCNFKCKKEE